MSTKRVLSGGVGLGGGSSKKRAARAKVEEKENVAPAASRSAAEGVMDGSCYESDDEIVFASPKRRRVEGPAFRDSGIGASVLETAEEAEDEEDGGIGVSDYDATSDEEDAAGQEIWLDGLGDQDDLDEDPDYVDLEADDLAGYASSEDSASEAEEEDDHDDHDEVERSPSPPRRSTRARGKRADTTPTRIAQIKKGKRQAGKLRVHLDPTKFPLFSLGQDGYAGWFEKISTTKVDEQISHGRAALEEYFRKVKQEAAGWPYSEYKAACPFERKTLGILQSKSWTAERLTELSLSGMCRYRQWLMGLGRPPSMAEQQAIPRSTVEQLGQMGLYANYIEHQDTEYRYIGSGTAQTGVGTRWQGYHRAKKAVAAGRKPVPQLDVVNHTKVLVQEDATSHFRLRASFPHGQISPTMVVVMEAMLIDFDRTMSDQVPTAGHDSTQRWHRVHSAAMRNASWARFPRSRLLPGRFVALNKASPYKQGTKTGIGAHRVRQWKQANMICSCCLHKVCSDERNLKQYTRLGAEVGVPLESITTMCERCCRHWARQARQDAAHATLMVAYRRRQMQQKTHGVRHTCAVCRSALPGGKAVEHARCDVPGLEDRNACKACSVAWSERLEELMDEEARQPDAVAEFITFRLDKARERSGGSKGVRHQFAIDAGECVTCERDITEDKFSIPCKLKGSEEDRWCNNCGSGYRKAKAKHEAKHGDGTWTDEVAMAWHFRLKAVIRNKVAKASDEEYPCPSCTRDMRGMTTRKAPASWSMMEGKVVCEACHSCMQRLSDTTDDEQMAWLEARPAFIAEKEENAPCPACGEETRAMYRSKAPDAWSRVAGKMCCEPCYTFMNDFERRQGHRATDAEQEAWLAQRPAAVAAANAKKAAREAAKTGPCPGCHRDMKDLQPRTPPASWTIMANQMVCDPCCRAMSKIKSRTEAKQREWVANRVKKMAKK